MKIRDGFLDFKYRLKNENNENIIRYIKKIDGNKYAIKNIVQCAYVDYLVEKLSKNTNVNKRDIYREYMPITYKKALSK